LSGKATRRVLYAVLILFFVLHNDFWFRDDPRRVLGLPAGFTYHIVLCLATALLMGLLVRFAWPEDL